jgi:hypothetical protein
MTAIREHGFTQQIRTILKRHFGDDAEQVFELSPLLGYLNHKTRSATKGSKARGSFANHYALYVLVEDYIQRGYLKKKPGTYGKYEGARFSDLLKRQRELPFGSKLQNHALNDRLNGEFKKFYPSVAQEPIVRDVASQRYWIQEDLIRIKVRDQGGKEKIRNIAQPILEIIDAYVATKREAFESFIGACKQIATVSAGDTKAVIKFIHNQLEPEVDARIFEIVSFAVLKVFYGDQQIYWGWSRVAIKEENLCLYKTGRTNANDGGIDFVMKPLGRFFQVTETVDMNKYFLDIDKIQRFPLTFVVKSTDSPDILKKNIKAQATAKYKIEAVVNGYMNAIEEIINIPRLLECLNVVIEKGRVSQAMEEIELQSKVEFNYVEVAEELVAEDEE